MFSSLSKRGDTKRFITGNDKFPVRHEFVPVNVNPDLHHTKLAGRKITGQKSSVVNGYRSLFPLVAHMNMRRDEDEAVSSVSSVFSKSSTVLKDSVFPLLTSCRAKRTRA